MTQQSKTCCLWWGPMPETHKGSFWFSVRAFKGSGLCCFAAKGPVLPLRITKLQVEMFTSNKEKKKQASEKGHGQVFLQLFICRECVSSSNSLLFSIRPGNPSEGTRGPGFIKRSRGRFLLLCRERCPWNHPSAETYTQRVAPTLFRARQRGLLIHPTSIGP